MKVIIKSTSKLEACLAQSDPRVIHEQLKANVLEHSEQSGENNSSDEKTKSLPSQTTTREENLLSYQMLEGPDKR